MFICMHGQGRIFKNGGGGQVRSRYKQNRGGGGPGGGPTLGSMLKDLHRGPKREGGGPPGSPGSAHDVCIHVCMH